MTERPRKRHVKVIDQFSGFFEKLGIITGCNGMEYNVDFVTTDDDGNEQKKSAVLERDQFKYIRFPWFCRDHKKSIL